MMTSVSFLRYSQPGLCTLSQASFVRLLLVCSWSFDVLDVVLLSQCHCQLAEEGDLQLVQGFSAEDFAFGELELFVDGNFASLCSPDVTLTPPAVNVACRELGFDGGVLLNFASIDAFIPVAASLPPSAATPMMESVRPLVRKQTHPVRE